MAVMDYKNEKVHILVIEKIQIDFLDSIESQGQSLKI